MFYHDIQWLDQLNRLELKTSEDSARRAKSFHLFHRFQRSYTPYLTLQFDLICELASLV